MPSTAVAMMSMDNGRCRCITCGIEKPNEEFPRDGARGSRKDECILCYNRFRKARHVERLMDVNMAPEQLAKLFGNLAQEMVWSVTADDILDMPVGTRIKSAQTLIELKQLMEGRPTRIISYQNIDSRAGLLKAMHAELERRGLTIDVTPTSVPEVTDVS